MVSMVFIAKLETWTISRKMWKEEKVLVDLLSFKTTLDTKLREFQYKILIRILYTNNMPFKFKKVNYPLCDFCEKELETIEHLFFHCTKVCVFWELKVALRFDIKDVLFGILDTDNIYTLVNHILLESKYFIYRCKLNKDSFCIRLLVDPDSKRRFKPNVISRNKTTKSIFITENGNPYFH